MNPLNTIKCPRCNAVMTTYIMYGFLGPKRVWDCLECDYFIKEDSYLEKRAYEKYEEPRGENDIQPIHRIGTSSCRTYPAA